ncbi:molybdate ABC transporter substrate-binding protein [Desulfonema magnum]|uniref:Molybdate ABC transporter, periplasmic binding protein n=1 Tax=Desulfonema magnum TaxID=45655 RepID=A0A975BSR6_9BACT|nr:molybdate ABC transporter substrate-binding protein [Desulfonema magnum]QTA91057.1 Molybdate ABC transporter, periplasmic binding protein [Desulfonema magnum]
MKRCVTFFLVLTVLLCPLSAEAEEKIMAAVAANFMKPFEEIVRLYEAKTNINIEPTYTSTGRLYAQIIKGAPYDVFLAADEKRPALLHKDGLAENPFVYAKGQVIIWSANKELCQVKDWKEMAQNPCVKKIAMANIETAPYGTVSMIALKDMGLWEKLQPKLVFAQTIAQVFQYASTESVDAGFCAYSSAFTDEGRKGCFLEVKEAQGVTQAACVLRRAADKEMADKFATFLHSPEADAVKRSYGYK